jgi:5-methylthioadenosine/S-adenosylhomocysteine deaminase
VAEVSSAPTLHDGRYEDRILLKAGTVLSLDPRVGDFDTADILVEHGKITAVEPQISADVPTVDCGGLVVLPGFIQTHHHHYETLMRSVIPDGLLLGTWPQESYMSVVQGIWTVGRIGDASDPVWDLGRPPLEPADVYLAEMVSSLSLVSHGVTMTADTSQSSHTPAHTDAMIQGLLDSGQRALYVYSRGENRQRGFEFPGAIDDHDHGIGRIASKYFASKDQLVTLGAAFPADPSIDAQGQTCAYTGWQLARAFDAHLTLHNVRNPGAVVSAGKDSRNGTDWSDVTMVHCTSWHDVVAQVEAGRSGYPNSTQSEAMALIADRGAHISIAPLDDHRRRRRERRAGSSRYADAWQGSGHRLPRRPQPAGRADAECAWCRRHADEPVARATRHDCRPIPALGFRVGRDRRAESRLSP